MSSADSPMHDLSTSQRGLFWRDVCYDIPLPSKARKAAQAAAKDASKADASEKGEVETDPQGSNGPRVGHRRILDHISGHVRPGELVAILGASGAGKTTLLNAISARISKKGDLTGQILLDGQKRNPATWKRTLGYVEQDDLLNGQLTVEETLTFAAKLRLPSKTFDAAAKRERVEETIEMLRLEKCRDSRVGSEGNRGISGGERKRTSVAQELLSDVSCLFLDEPTSGLDAFAALSLIENLREVTRTRDLVTLATIHQPSWRIFNLFDRVVLLTRGGVFYDGPPALTVPYFASFGINVPEGVNPADHFIQIAEAYEATQAAEERVQLLLSHWKSAEGQHWMAQNRQQAIDDAKAEKRQESPGLLKRRLSSKTTVPMHYNDKSFAEWPSLWAYEMMTLLHRNYLLQIRNPALLIGTAGQTVVLCVLIGFSFFRLKLNEGGALGRIGLLFFVLINSSFALLFPIISVFPLQRSIMMRERSAGMYRTTSFYFAALFVEIPSQLFQRVWFYVILYFMTGLKLEAGAFFIWLLVNGIQILISIAMGFTIGAASPNIQIANIIAPLFNVIFLLFGEFLDQKPSVWAQN